MPRPARQAIEPTQPRPLSALEAANAEHDRADQALARASANLEEAQRREAETKRLLADATESARTAGLALAEDPEAEGLLDDAVTEMARLQHRLKALQEQTVPAAVSAVEARRSEVNAAAEAHGREALREAVRTQLIPAVRRFREALLVAVDALEPCREAQRKIRIEHGLAGNAYLGALSLAVPNEIARLTETTVTQAPWAGSPVNFSTPSSGGDLIAELCNHFDLSSETLD